MWISKRSPRRSASPRKDEPVWSPGLVSGFCFVRPAWAHSCGYKSRRKLITANREREHGVGVEARQGQSRQSRGGWTVEPFRSGAIPGGSVCACWRTRHRRRSSASLGGSGSGIGVFHQIQKVFFRWYGRLPRQRADCNTSASIEDPRCSASECHSEACEWQASLEQEDPSWNIA